MENLTPRERFEKIAVEIGEDFVRVWVDGVELSARGLNAVLAPGLLVDADGQIAEAKFGAELPAVARV